MSLVNALPIVRGQYRENVELSRISWFKTGGRAEVLFIPKDADDLIHFLKSKPNNIQISVIGACSNLLIGDQGIKGVTIKLMNGFNSMSLDSLTFTSDSNKGNHSSSKKKQNFNKDNKEKENSNKEDQNSSKEKDDDNSNKGNYIKCGTSVLDKDLALFACENNISGFEFLYTIPGNIGGALAMNAGAYLGEISEIAVEVKSVDFLGNIKIFKRDEIGYCYRGKKLSNEWIFIEALFVGKAGNKEKIAKKMREMEEKRQKTQPIRVKTTGSVFKNPSNAKAWELIDGAGCRGFRIGDAMISDIHCNFIINTGNATSKDILDIIKTVKHRVFQKYGVELEEEVVYLGE